MNFENGGWIGFRRVKWLRKNILRWGKERKRERESRYQERKTWYSRQNRPPVKSPRTGDYVRLHGKRGADGIVTNYSSLK